MQAEQYGTQLDETSLDATDVEISDTDIVEDGDETGLLARGPGSGEGDSLRFLRFEVDARSPNAVDAGASRGRVLVVDDDGSFAITCARMLDASGYAVRVANDGQSAIALAAKEHFDAVVTDINLPDQNGMQVLQGVRKSDPDMPIILVSGQPDLEIARAALEWDAVNYLAKPVSAAQLERELGRAMHRRRTTARMHIVEDQEKDQEDTSQRFTRAMRGLWIAFQPVISWSRKSIVGYQAIMQSTEPSFPTPAALLSAARELSQLGVLGQCVRERIAALMSGGYASETMFVELQPAELFDDDLYDPGAPLAPFADQICFEISQSPTQKQVPEFRAHMQRLRALGYRIAVGDIGAADTGLGSLALVEPDGVKLDMSLFRNTESLRVKRTLIRALVRLCEDLESSLIATGVDSEDERTIFTGFGGDLMQGLRFAEPAFPFPTPSF
jgi:EAL domain-containing protein (putative c-di-GMP-specific phosphodiesterase class I)